MVSTTRLVVRLVDRLLAGYFAAVTIIIAIRGNIFERDIIFVLFTHILFFVLLWLFTKLGPANTVGAFFHDFYPVMLLLAFYGAIGILTMRLDAADIYARDAVVQGWEQAIFGSQISYEWIRRAPSVFWSGLLHLAYLSYFPILVLGPLVLWLRGKRDGARRTVLHSMIAFVPCYLAFVLFPVAGPNWIFPEPTGAVRDVWSARIVYDVLEGSSFGAAFPSSHAAASGVVVLATLHEWRAWGLTLMVPAVLLVIGTVYCQMHYGVDVLAGLVVLAGVAGVRRMLGERY